MQPVPLEVLPLGVLPQMQLGALPQIRYPRTCVICKVGGPMFWRKKQTVSVPAPFTAAMQTQATECLAYERALLSQASSSVTVQAVADHAPMDPKPKSTRQPKPHRRATKRSTVRPSFTVITGGRSMASSRVTIVGNLALAMQPMTDLDAAAQAFADTLIWSVGGRVTPSELLTAFQGEGEGSRNAAEALKRTLRGRGARYVKIRGKHYVSGCYLKG